jgi:hypothetical protein
MHGWPICYANRIIGNTDKTKHDKENSMKLNRMITMCAVGLALVMSIGDTFAQINNGGGNGGGGFGGGGGGFGGGGNGGGRRNRGGNAGANFDPAQLMQRRVDNVRQQLDITNDTEWSAIQPLVQKVLEAQQAAQQGGGRGGFGGFGGGRRGGNNGPNGNNGNANVGGRGGAQTNPEAEALRQAVENDAPAAQLKDLLAKYNAAQKAKQAALAAAQANLRKVLTVKQESMATLIGLLSQ